MRETCTCGSEAPGRCRCGVLRETTAAGVHPLVAALPVFIREVQLGDIEYIADTWARTLQALDRTPGSAARCKAAARAMLIALDATGGYVRVACSPDAPEVIRGYQVRAPGGVPVFAYVRRQFRGAGIYRRLREAP